jgi:DUF4097 and DUF4098 domain-containing protein YvlB
MPTYPTPDPVTLVVRIPTGRIEITTEDTKETTVEVLRTGGRGAPEPTDVVIDFRPSKRSGGQLMVVAERGHKSWFGKDASYHVTIRTPHGAEVQGVSGSADFRGVGRFGSLEVRSASGDVWFDDVGGRANVKSASGDLRLGSIEGPVVVNTTSGNAEIHKARDVVNAALVSGDLKVLEAGGDVKGRSVSGDLRIESFDRGRAELSSVSGDVQVGVLPDRRVWMDLLSRSGDTSCDLDVGSGEGSGAPDVRIEAKSVSGDIRVRRASAR